MATCICSLFQWREWQMSITINADSREDRHTSYCYTYIQSNETFNIYTAGIQQRSFAGCMLAFRNGQEYLERRPYTVRTVSRETWCLWQIFFTSCEHRLLRSLQEVSPGIIICIFKSETLVLTLKKAGCSLQGNGENLPLAEEFQCLGNVFTSDGERQRVTGMWIGSEAARICGRSARRWRSLRNYSQLRSLVVQYAVMKWKKVTSNRGGNEVSRQGGWPFSPWRSEERDSPRDCLRITAVLLGTARSLFEWFGIQSHKDGPCSVLAKAVSSACYWRVTPC